MAVEQPGFKLGCVSAAADLRTHQFKFMKMSGDFAVDLNTTNTGKCVGVLQDKPNTGDPACVMVDGVTKVKAGGTITAAGDPVMSNGAGLAIAATGAGAYVLGFALESAVNGDTISVLLGRGVMTS